MSAQTSTLQDVLKRYWGYTEFRPLQRESIDSVLADRDSVVILPTGGGKSLCFQIPAIARDGMALVVSPLISLMKDQVDALTANGVGAAAIHSALTVSERKAIHEDMQNGAVRILYVSPERLSQPRFVDYLRAMKISFIAIDEAHCISHWGHDFRPEYRELRVLRTAFPELSFHAYTATATPQVRDDIVEQLSLRDPRVIIGSFDRPNLIYRAVRREALIEQVCGVIDRFKGDSGIVYCISRKNVDELCAALRARGYKALPYHAGMDDASRKRNQEAFTKDRADIVVATIAFGMGIDKSNVRYVIHTGLPKSLEHYQQETGRAGRDGLESECWLFFSQADFMLWKSIMQKEEGPGADVALRKLNDMLAFATSMQCRRRAVLAYFGETYTKPRCGACDVCLSEMETHADAAHIARTIVDCVRQIGEYAGPTYTALVLVGSREERVIKGRADRFPTYGALREHGQPAVRAWIDQLVSQGYLEKYQRGEYPVLVPGPLANDDPEMLGAAIGRAAQKKEKKSKGAASLGLPVDRELFEELRVLRRGIADARGVAAFLILSDASLNDMARKKPVTLAAFRKILGIGDRKAADFGETFTKAIQTFCDLRGLHAATLETEKHPVRRNAAPRAQDLANKMFVERRGIEEVCEELRRSKGTVEGYLAEYVESNTISDPEPWASVETLERVRAAAGSSEEGRLKPIHEALGGQVSYMEIRVCLACIRNGG